MTDIRKDSVTFHTIDSERTGQRLDNYLAQRLKGVPKSHIYRIIRSGEVRVNKKKVAVTYRLLAGDVLRLPPLIYKVRETCATDLATPITRIFEDNTLLVVDKPAGLAVHGGSGLMTGLIEQLRTMHPDYPYLELAHRIDRDTSGLLILAKKRSVLIKLHEMMRRSVPDKRYLALAVGPWAQHMTHVTLPLAKFTTHDGEQRMRVDEEGQASHTIFSIRQRYQNFTLLQARLKTGRMHQIRVHMAANACPIAGDTKYGDLHVNRALAIRGLRRMFLHAWRLAFPHPVTGTFLQLEAPLPQELSMFLDTLEIS